MCRHDGCNCACGEWHGDTDEQNEIKNFQCPHEVFIYSLINHQGVKMIQCADCGYKEPQFNKDGTLKKIKKRQ